MVGRITSITHAVDVPDLARGMRWYTGLLGRGPDLEPVEGVIAFCEFDDPFGNHLSLYQVL